MMIISKVLVGSGCPDESELSVYRKGNKKMGAWGYGVFDDDTACDFVIDLFESDDVAGYCEKEFDSVIGLGYIEYDAGIAVSV